MPKRRGTAGKDRAGGCGRHDRGKACRSAGYAPTTRPVAKPISENVKKGLEWLLKTQLENGGWGQGEESPTWAAKGS